MNSTTLRFTAFLPWLLGATLLLAALQNDKAETTVQEIAPGVTLTQEFDPGIPNLINVLTVDLTTPGVRLGVGIGQDQITGGPGRRGRESVSRLARRHNAIAAVNADFFPYTGDPLGVGIQDGELFSEPWTGNGKGGPRVAMGVLDGGRQVVFENLNFLGDLQAPDGDRVFLTGIDRPVGVGDAIVFTHLFGPSAITYKGGVVVVLGGVNLPVRANKLMVGKVETVSVDAVGTVDIPSDGVVVGAAPGRTADDLLAHCHAGDRIGIVMAVAPSAHVMSAVQIAQLPRTTVDLPSRSGMTIDRDAYTWAEVQEAVSGGPRLLTNGQVTVDGAAEGFDASFTDEPNPRTAVGLSADGHKLYIATVDGRQTQSRGATLAEMAAILQRFGAYNAMNFDGGGSTAMAVAGMVVNSPSGSGAERPVADMLLVYSDNPYVPMPEADPALSDIDPVSCSLQVPTSPVAVNSETRLGLLMNGAPLSTSESQRVVWQGASTGAVGLVTQAGDFIAVQPGIAVVSALYRGRIVMGSITVSGPVPQIAAAKIQAEFLNVVGQQPSVGQLSVRVVDQSGVAQQGVSVTVAVTGGKPAVYSASTGVDGYVTLPIHWNGQAGGIVVISSPGLTPVTLAQLAGPAPPALVPGAPVTPSQTPAPVEPGPMPEP